MTDGIVPWLFGFTLIAVLVFAVWQWWSAREARKHHESSAMPPPDEHPTREPVDSVRREALQSQERARGDPQYQRK
jgi:hypothetical protein